MSNMWEKFDREIDDETRKQIAEAENSEFVEVPHGDYEVKIQQMELKLSKAGNPMLSIWFKVVSGEYSNNLIFMNQVLNIPFQISIANKMLRSLAPDKNIEFESYSQYADLIMDIFEEIDGNFEYALKYGEKKGYNTFEIIDIFQV